MEEIELLFIYFFLSSLLTKLENFNYLGYLIRDAVHNMYCCDSHSHSCTAELLDTEFDSLAGPTMKSHRTISRKLPLLLSLVVFVYWHDFIVNSYTATVRGSSCSSISELHADFTNTTDNPTLSKSYTSLRRRRPKAPYRPLPAPSSKTLHSHIELSVVDPFVLVHHQ